MKDSQVSEAGIFTAVALTLVATAGHFLTDGRGPQSYEWLWLVLFGASFFTLCGAAVNFDPKRWKE